MNAIHHTIPVRSLLAPAKPVPVCLLAWLAGLAQSCMSAASPGLVPVPGVLGLLARKET